MPADGLQQEDAKVEVIDPRQLGRIEALHRGFLYQHLYGANCLLRAGRADVAEVLAERDEDVEVTLPNRRVYVQVKTRSSELTIGDIVGALDRFAEIRNEHANGARSGKADFVIASNAPPALKLADMLDGEAWPDDVALHWPDGPEPEVCLPKPPRDIAGAIAACNAFASDLPFAMLRPETLTWKLAGLVMLASTGATPREDHRFTRQELPELFEQLVLQMQELPTPPLVYRAQIDEPSLMSEDRVRILQGMSGAGKTVWVAQAAQHAATPITYLDVIETPGPALASAVAREVAARMFGRRNGVLGEILLPGAGGLDTLGALSVKLGETSQRAAVVIDNAHRVPATDLKAIVDRAPNIRFVMLCQPGAATEALAASLMVSPEVLHGWDEDTIAAAVSDAGCRADYAACERLSRLTGALPFYVLNAASVAAREYDGSIAAFCADVEAQTHIVSIAQELILKRSFDGLTTEQRETIAALSLADVALTRDEAGQFLQRACGIDAKASAARLRDLPETGALELFGNAGLKIHDAVRLLGLADAAKRGGEWEQQARSALREVIVASIRRDWSVAKLALLIRLLGQLGDARILVQFATDELFHEMGVWPEIEPFLVAVAADDEAVPETRLWALDGLVFNDLREGFVTEALVRIDAMQALIETHDLEDDAWLGWAMKRMLALSASGDVDAVLGLLDAVDGRVPDSPEHRRIFRYNRALALFKLGQYAVAAEEASELSQEYYAEIGLDPDDVMGRNAPQLRPLLAKGKDLTDSLKHLADTLDLMAQAMGAMGLRSGLARIHALKFYELARAPQSLVRVGQDLVDEFVAVHDFIGARQIMESSIFPIIQSMGLVSWVLPVRALYAVVLAYCGDHDGADAEIARILPYRDAMDPRHNAALSDQQGIIAELRLYGPPPQRQITIPPGLQQFFDERRGLPHAVEKRTKVGRNERCPCGSGRKHKHCHGR